MLSETAAWEISIKKDEITITGKPEDARYLAEFDSEKGSFVIKRSHNRLLVGKPL